MPPSGGGGRLSEDARLGPLLGEARPGGRRLGDAHLLRLGTHNVRFLDPRERIGKLKRVCDVWHRLRLDMVLVQEHGIKYNDHVRTAKKMKGWKTFWRFNLNGAARAGGGVLIAWKASAERSGRIKVHTETAEDWAPPREVVDGVVGGMVNDGRLLAVDVDWGGHKLVLINAYLPSGAAAAQKDFIYKRLMPLQRDCASRGRTPLAAGDWNFVTDPSVDRLTLDADGAGLRAATGRDSTGVFWQTCLGRQLVDVARHHKPNSRSMTRFGHDSAARLDRWYIGASAVGFAQPVGRPGGLGLAGRNAAAADGDADDNLIGNCESDHLPAVMVLTPKVPTGPRGKPPARLRLDFAKDAALRKNFGAWLTAAAADLPVDDAGLIRAWPKFIRYLRHHVNRLNAKARAARYAVVAAAEADVLARGLAVIRDGEPAAALAASVGLAALRRAAVERLEEEERIFQLLKRRKWDAGRERPNHTLSRRLETSKAGEILALRTPAGVIVTTAAACAHEATRFSAHVSRQPATLPDAKAEVIAAIARQQAARPSEEQAATLGDAVVTAAEVRRELRGLNPGTAPGSDGITSDLWRIFKDEAAPLLARLFTAIGRTEAVPAGFLDSVIVYIHKRGDKLESANYRPISLTQSAYRALGRVLSTRLAVLAPAIIDPAQTAFMAGRRIGENVLLVRSIASKLSARGETGLLAVCDFRKAYDTIDRSFLFEVTSALGLGDGFVRWQRTLLTNTKGAACVRGHTATPRLFAAGARQGCCAAPGWFNLLMQALLCWLKDRGFGLVLDDGGALRVVAIQFADDTKALLDRESVPTFVEAMTRFAEASGLHLELSKTTLLPLGAPADLPEEMGTLRVAAEATALGFTFAAFSGAATGDLGVPRLS